MFGAKDLTKSLRRFHSLVLWRNKLVIFLFGIFLGRLNLVLLVSGSHLGRMGKDLLESVLKSVNIVVYQVLAVNFSLVDQTHQSETFVNFAQINHYVLLVVCVRQSYNRTRFFVEF